MSKDLTQIGLLPEESSEESDKSDTKTIAEPSTRAGLESLPAFEFDSPFDGALGDESPTQDEPRLDHGSDFDALSPPPQEFENLAPSPVGEAEPPFEPAVTAPDETRSAAPDLERRTDQEWNLRIHGTLAPEDREKLLDALSGQKTDFRPLDFEPQFAAGSLLLPRISEYLAAVIVQTLRAAPVKITLKHADLAEDPLSTGHASFQDYQVNDPAQIPRSAIVVTHLSEIPELGAVETIDVIQSSGILPSSVAVESESRGYQQLVERLKEELIRKAHYKRAEGLIGFAVNLSQISDTYETRVSVIATAVRRPR